MCEILTLIFIFIVFPKYKYLKCMALQDWFDLHGEGSIGCMWPSMISATMIYNSPYVMMNYMFNSMTNMYKYLFHPMSIY